MKILFLTIFFLLALGNFVVHSRQLLSKQDAIFWYWSYMKAMTLCAYQLDYFLVSNHGNSNDDQLTELKDIFQMRAENLGCTPIRYWTVDYKDIDTLLLSNFVLFFELQNYPDEFIEKKDFQDLVQTYRKIYELYTKVDDVGKSAQDKIKLGVQRARLEMIMKRPGFRRRRQERVSAGKEEEEKARSEMRPYNKTISNWMWSGIGKFFSFPELMEDLKEKWNKDQDKKLEDEKAKLWSKIFLEPKMDFVRRLSDVVHNGEKTEVQKINQMMDTYKIAEEDLVKSFELQNKADLFNFPSHCFPWSKEYKFDSNRNMRPWNY